MRSFLNGAPFFLLLIALVPILMSCVSAQGIPDPTLHYRVDLQNTVRDLDDPIWKYHLIFRPQYTQAGGLPSVLEAGFYPSAPGNSALDTYRQKLRLKSPWSSRPVEHLMGTIACKGSSGTEYRLGVNVFLPQSAPKGTFLFVHGYLSHAGYFSWLLDQMTARGWAVVTLDLPGHGFSSGERDDIPDFRDYGDAVAALMRWAAASGEIFPRPWVQAGHSLGGASSLEYYSREPQIRPDLLVLAAPLVRTVWYEASQFGLAVAGGVLKNLPPLFPFDDYLGGITVPTHWFLALTIWNKSFQNVGSITQKTLVLQGTNDGVVDAGFNIPVLKKTLTNADFVMIDNYSHNLLEDEKERTHTLELLLENLKKQGLGEKGEK